MVIVIFNEYEVKRVFASRDQILIILIKETFSCNEVVRFTFLVIIII